MKNHRKRWAAGGALSAALILAFFGLDGMLAPADSQSSSDETVIHQQSSAALAQQAIETSTSGIKLDALTLALSAARQLKEPEAETSQNLVKIALLAALSSNRSESVEFVGHADTVWSAQFSPDGNLVATGSDDGTARLWNRNGMLVSILYGEGEHSADAVLGSNIVDAAFSPNGQIVATALENGSIKLWATNGTLLHTLEGSENSWTTDISFSPDSQMITTAANGGDVNLWRTDGTLLRTLESHQSSMTEARFSPDGELIVTGDFSGVVKLWSRDGTLLRTLESHTDAIFDISFSPDSQKVITASRDGTAVLWNRDGSLLHRLESHGDWVVDVSISPDGQTFVTGGKDGTAKLWSINGELLHTLEGYGPVVDVHFSPDGQTIVTGGGITKLWRTDGTLIREIKGYGQMATDVRFSPDGRFILMSGDDGDNKPDIAKLWQIDDTTLLDARSELHAHEFSRDAFVNFIPRANLLSVGSRKDLSAIKLLQLDGTLLYESESFNKVFSPQGNMFVNLNFDDTSQLVRSDGTLLHNLPGHHLASSQAAFSANGRMLVTNSADGTVKLWRTEDGVLLRTITAHESGLSAVDFASDNETIVGVYFLTAGTGNCDRFQNIPRLSSQVFRQWRQTKP